MYDISKYNKIFYWSRAIYNIKDNLYMFSTKNIWVQMNITM